MRHSPFPLKSLGRWFAPIGLTLLTTTQSLGAADNVGAFGATLYKTPDEILSAGAKSLSLKAIFPFLPNPYDAGLIRTGLRLANTRLNESQSPDDPVPLNVAYFIEQRALTLPDSVLGYEKMPVHNMDLFAHPDDNGEIGRSLHHSLHTLAFHQSRKDFPGWLAGKEHPPEEQKRVDRLNRLIDIGKRIKDPFTKLAALQFYLDSLEYDDAKEAKNPQGQFISTDWVNPAQKTLGEDLGQCNDFASAMMVLAQAIGLPQDKLYTFSLVVPNVGNHAVMGLRRNSGDFLIVEHWRHAYYPHNPNAGHWPMTLSMRFMSDEFERGSIVDIEDWYSNRAAYRKVADIKAANEKITPQEGDVKLLLQAFDLSRLSFQERMAKATAKAMFEELYPEGRPAWDSLVMQPTGSNFRLKL